jgi:hypothetical protein
MAKESTSERGEQSASDYSLRSFEILTSDGQSVDISTMIVEMNIYEDLFSATISGEALISDALDIVSVFSIHGNEFVKIIVDKPTLNEPIEKTFRIYKITNKLYDQSSMLNYSIHFASEETILAPSIRVSKSYRGMKISDMVSDIAKNLMKINSNKLFIEDSEGVFDIIVPNMDPLQAIHWLTIRAYAKNKSAFFFYEDRDGFKFISYESLAKAQTYNKYYKSLKFGDDNIKNAKTFNFLSGIQDFDVMKGTRYGAYASALMRFDMVNRKFDATMYNTYQFSDRLLNKNLIANKAKNRLGYSLYDSYLSSLKYVITNDSDPNVNPMNFQYWMGPTIAKLGQLTNYKMVGTIPGDVLLKVGSIIEVEIPNITSQDKAYDINKFRSGKYMISSLNHKFVGRLYTTTMEFMTDSVNSAIPTEQNNTQELNEAKGML